MLTPIQMPCQSQKTAENGSTGPALGLFANQDLVEFANAWLGTFATSNASELQAVRRSLIMLGKVAGAWLGEKIIGRNEGAKGAILGYGAAALAKRSVPTLAALALGGWAFRKWRQRRRSRAAYPSDAAPSS